MKDKNGSLKQYLHRVRVLLPCSGKQKQRILSEIRGNIESYALENPDCGPEAIQDHFGTPQQIANSYIEEMDTEELAARLRIRKKLLRVAVVCAVTVGIMFALVIGISLVNVLRNSNWHMGVKVITP